MRLVILVHGIHTSRRKALGWYEGLSHWIRQRRPETEVTYFLYGWTGGVSVRFPVVGFYTRKHLVKKLQRRVRKLVKKHGPELELDAVGHSFGTYLIHNSMTRGKWHAFYRRIVYMAGIVSSRETFEEEKGHFEALLNLHSRGDDVVRLAPFGHSGYRGFTRADSKKVMNLEFTPDNHDSYTQPGSAWRAVAEFLGIEGIAEAANA